MFVEVGVSAGTGVAVGGTGVAVGAGVSSAKTSDDRSKMTSMLNRRMTNNKHWIQVIYIVSQPEVKILNNFSVMKRIKAFFGILAA